MNIRVDLNRHVALICEPAGGVGCKAEGLGQDGGVERQHRHRLPRLPSCVRLHSLAPALSASKTLPITASLTSPKRATGPCTALI